MSQVGTAWAGVCFLPAAPECARRVRPQPILLRAARRAPPRSARTMVRRHELRATDGSQNEVQGPNMAGALGRFALAVATVPGREIRNFLRDAPRKRDKGATAIQSLFDQQLCLDTSVLK